MNVILSGGPKGGDVVTDWPDGAVDGDLRVFETAEGPAEYRLDFEFGQATFTGIQPAPKPLSFASKVAV